MAKQTNYSSIYREDAIKTKRNDWEEKEKKRKVWEKVEGKIMLGKIQR